MITPEHASNAVGMFVTVAEHSPVTSGKVNGAKGAVTSSIVTVTGFEVAEHKPFAATTV